MMKSLLNWFSNLDLTMRFLLPTALVGFIVFLSAAGFTHYLNTQARNGESSELVQQFVPMLKSAINQHLAKHGPGQALGDRLNSLMPQARILVWDDEGKLVNRALEQNAGDDNYKPILNEFRLALDDSVFVFKQENENYELRLKKIVLSWCFI